VGDLVLASCLFFAQGASLKWIAVTPARWSTFEQLSKKYRQIRRAISRNSPEIWRCFPKLVLGFIGKGAV